MVKYISKLINDEELYYLKDAEARAGLDNKTGADDFENLGYVITIQTVDDAIAEANKEDSVISFDTDTADVNEGETLTKAVVITAGDGAITYSSSDTDVATVNSSGVVTGVSAGTCTITASIAETNNYKPATASYTLTVIYYDPYMGHDYVEIGGLKWATMNIGANSITDTGLYFQWGDTQGYTASLVGSGSGKKYFGWTDYKYCNGTSTSITKYNSTDGKTVLDASDDAAIANWGGRWRMPTTAELQALGEAVNTTWTTNYRSSGVAGLILTEKNNSNNELFFPCNGYIANGNIYNPMAKSHVWTSSLSSNYDYVAYDTAMLQNDYKWLSTSGRMCGIPIRPVAN